VNELLENEREMKNIVPHPLSFINYHSLWIIPFIWGIFLLWFYSKFDLTSMAIGITLWIAGLSIFGIIASFLMIKWRIFILYITVAIVGTFIMWKYNLWNKFNTFLPGYTMIVFIFGMLFVEIYRKSHCYTITNFRLILKGGIIRKKERSLRYDKITDLSGEQGILGRIFGFGNIIPITQSGFGLGEDEAFIGGGVSSGKRAKFFGFAGGGKDVKMPRARSYYELHGVYPYKEIKNLVENLIQESTIAPYEKEQVELQRKIVDLLEKKDKNREGNM